MTTTKIIQHVNYINLTNSFDDISINELIDVLSYADAAYFNDEDVVIDDSLYDTIKQYVYSVIPTHTYFKQVGSDTRGGKIPLPVPMMSLNQVYAGETLEWVKKHNLQEEKIIISDKLDGASGLIEFNNFKFTNGYSRGNGVEGADITRHYSQMKSVWKTLPDNSTMLIRGETIINNNNFEIVRQLMQEKTGKLYANPRNMVSGLMNAKTNFDFVYNYIDFVAYEVVQSVMDKSEQLLFLGENNFLTPWYTTVLGKDLTDDLLSDILADRRKKSPYQIDGLVLNINSNKKVSSLRTDKPENPLYAVKYKMLTAADIVETTVLSVEWNISKHGYWKPKVIIAPVQLFGTTVRQATAFNAGFIKNNNIGPGTVIKITKSGMVIPHIHSVVKPTIADLPEDVEYTWTETGVDIVSSKPEEYQDVKLNQLIAFFTDIKVPALKEGNIKKLLDKGYSTPEDIINMSQEDMSYVLGSEIIGEKVYNGILERLTNIQLNVLMGAYSTSRGIGARKMKPLIQQFGEKLLNITSIDDIMEVKGFDKKSAEKVLLEIPRFKEFLIQVQEKCSLYQPPVVEDGLFTNEFVVFTGFRDGNLEQFIESNGGVMQSGVSKKTTLLLMADVSENSGKAKKARELGIKIQSVDDFRNEHGK